MHDTKIANATNEIIQIMSKYKLTLRDFSEVVNHVIGFQNQFERRINLDDKYERYKKIFTDIEAKPYKCLYCDEWKDCKGKNANCK